MKNIGSCQLAFPYLGKYAYGARRAAVASVRWTILPTSGIWLGAGTTGDDGNPRACW